LALRVYIDASVVVALFTMDSSSAKASTFLRTRAPVIVISDFVAAEFASAIAGRVRMKTLTIEQARTALSNFDVWSGTLSSRIETLSIDIRTAETFLRRLASTLRTPDAIHIAIAQRTDAELATFDAKMARSARMLGMKTSKI
jgi:predicted nucleic acid-binding protein